MNCFQNVKYGVNCREAAERYGVEVNHHGMALCPFHNDRHPDESLSLRVGHSSSNHSPRGLCR